MRTKCSKIKVSLIKGDTVRGIVLKENAENARILLKILPNTVTLLVKGSYSVEVSHHFF